MGFVYGQKQIQLEEPSGKKLGASKGGQSVGHLINRGFLKEACMKRPGSLGLGLKLITQAEGEENGGDRQLSVFHGPHQLCLHLFIGLWTNKNS